MENYKIIDGKTVATPEMKVKRFFARYPEIDVRMSMETLKKVYGQIGDISDFMLVTYNTDLKSEVLATLLMKSGKYANIQIMNAYALLDIFLGNSEDYKSILDIENDIVCVYLGYSEFENKRQSDVIEQLMEQQKIHRKKFWLLYKGNAIKEEFPRLVRKIDELGGTVYNLTSSAKSSKKSYDEEDDF